MRAYEIVLGAIEVATAGLPRWHERGGAVRLGRSVSEIKVLSISDRHPT